LFESCRGTPRWLVLDAFTKSELLKR